MFKGCRGLFLSLALTMLSPAISNAQDLDGADFFFPEVIDTENRLYVELLRGRVVIDLRPELAPQHVIRIKRLTRQGFYDGLFFHRVIDGFMAQTGDPTGTGMGSSDLQNVQDEFSDEKFKRGTLGMARGQGYNSGNSQFFIMVTDGPWLNGEYTILGSVTSGMELIDDLRVGSKLDNGLVKNPDRLYTMKVLADIEQRVVVAAQTKTAAEAAVIAAAQAVLFDGTTEQQAEIARQHATLMAEQATLAAADTVEKTRIKAETKAAAEAAARLTKSTRAIFVAGRKSLAESDEILRIADGEAAAFLAISDRANADLAAKTTASKAADDLVKSARKEQNAAIKASEKAAKQSIAAIKALPKAIKASTDARIAEAKAVARKRKSTIRRATQRVAARTAAEAKAIANIAITKDAAAQTLEAVPVAVEALFEATFDALAKQAVLDKARLAAEEASQDYEVAAEVAMAGGEGVAISQSDLSDAGGIAQDAVEAQTQADAAFVAATLAKDAAIVAQAIAEEVGILARVSAVQMTARAKAAVVSNDRAARLSSTTSLEAIVAAAAVEADIPISERQKTQ